MRNAVFTMLSILLQGGLVVGQGKLPLTGIWYGKIRSYQNGQYEYRTARIFTEHKVPGWQEKLIVDKNYNYDYTSISGTDTTKEKGKVIQSGDTLIFVQRKINVNEYFEPVKYYLYQLQRKSIAYSHHSIAEPKAVEEEQSIFTKVEEAAVGDYQFYKTIYQSLLNTTAQSKDSVYLNEYEVVVRKDKTIDISTFNEKNAKRVYFEAIKTSLLNLKAGITPAQQNGKPVTAHFNFWITY